MNQNIEIENLEIYKQIVNHMSESLWIWDKNKNTIYANKVFSSLTGYEIEEIIWENYCNFWDNENKEIIKKAEQNKNIKYEAEIKTRKWDKIPVLCSWTKTENWWIVITISDLRELNALKEAKEKLTNLNKTKDEFISIVGHELRTPLTSIRWYLSMIIDWDMWEINSNIKKALSHSYKSSIRLINLVNDVLSIEKMESGKMNFHLEEINIKSLIKSIYKDIYIEIEKKWLDLILNIDKSIENEIITVDKDKLKQVFLNLLTNSIKFTKSWFIKIKATKNRENIRFEIIDSWVGIEKSKISWLFNKFSQVESSLQRKNTSGLWLWLAISQKIIKNMWSEIKIESEENKGSKFYFDLKIT